VLEGLFDDVEGGFFVHFEEWNDLVDLEYGVWEWCAYISLFLSRVQPASFIGFQPQSLEPHLPYIKFHKFGNPQPTPP
jgi:hypothetical protein